MGFINQLITGVPSGYVNSFAIENGHLVREFSHNL